MHQHDVELVDPELRAEPERFHETGAGLVEVREPVRVEHDALPVALGVPHPNAMVNALTPRSSAA